MDGRRVDPMAVLGPHLDEGIPLARAAKVADVPIRTAPTARFPEVLIFVGLHSFAIVLLLT